MSYAADQTPHENLRKPDPFDATALHAIDQLGALIIDENDYPDCVVKEDVLLTAEIDSEYAVFVSRYRKLEILHLYQHSVLEKATEIRLIRIPAKADGVFRAVAKDYPLCELVVVDLAIGTIDFEALSYTWGDLHAPTNNRLVFIKAASETRYLYVPDNLSSAIRRLQEQNRDRYVWADQLCINQYDPTERSHQVSMMPQIYAAATKTVVWLGEQSKLQTEAYNEVLVRLRGDPNDAHVQATLSDTSSPESLAIISFFSNPWFTRVWVFQEVVISPKVDIKCGALECSFEDLAQVVAIAGFSTAGMEAVYIMSCFRRVYQLARPNITLLDLLSDIHLKFKCFDPRDKVFALLSIPEKADGIMGLIDYNLSVEEVYTRTARFLVRSSGTLDLLASVSPKPGNFGVSLSSDDNPEAQTERLETAPYELPTWVPDWTSTHRVIGIEKTSNPKFSACRQRAHNYVESPNPKVLHARGKLVDKIQHIAPHEIANPGATTFHDYFPLFGLTESCQATASEQDIQALYVHIIITAMADGALRVERPKCQTTPEELARIYVALLQRLRDESVIDDFATPECLQDYLQYLAVARNRRLAVTGSGTLALVPDCAEVGDAVAILHGSSVPVLLRECVEAAEVEVLGQCYVNDNDTMYGEAVDWDVENADVFLLR